MSHFPCPKCQASATATLDSRMAGPSRRRRRHCQTCGHRFTTYERLETRHARGKATPGGEEKPIPGAVKEATMLAETLQAGVGRKFKRIMAVEMADRMHQGVIALVSELLRAGRTSKHIAQVLHARGVELKPGAIRSWKRLRWDPMRRQDEQHRRDAQLFRTLSEEIGEHQAGTIIRLMALRDRTREIPALQLLQEARAIAHQEHLQKMQLARAKAQELQLEVQRLKGKDPAPN